MRKKKVVCCHVFLFCVMCYEKTKKKQCIKCQTSFCWICEQIIDDAPVPSHYKDPDSPCHGKQFEGADMGQTPPMWAIIVLAIFTLIFGLPTLVASIVLGMYVFKKYCGNFGAKKKSK